MRLICGLGNPGREYERHRHNVGFMVVDDVAARSGIALNQVKFDGQLGAGTWGSHKLLLAKPQTFMNLSGRCLASLARFYKLEPADVLVVHDELDLPFGRLQLKAGGGSGGHNGLRSIAEHWGEQDYVRLRIGIGKPTGPNGRERVVGHVLGNFSNEETGALGGLLQLAAQACECWLKEGLPTAMNRFNRR